MLNTTIQLAGRRVHLVHDVRDSDVCTNHARHVRLEGRTYLQGEINRAAQTDALALAEFRNLAETYGLLQGVHRVTDAKVLEHVAWLLDTERLIPIECVELRQESPGAPAAPAPPPARTRPPVALEDLKTWVEIELLYDTGKPVPNERYVFNIATATTES